MQKKKIILSMPKEWIDKLESVRRQEYFTSIQEVIYNLVRKEYFVPQYKPNGTGRKNKRGRPEKKTFEDYFSTPTKETRKLEREGLI